MKLHYCACPGHGTGLYYINSWRRAGVFEHLGQLEEALIAQQICARDPCLQAIADAGRECGVAIVMAR